MFALLTIFAVALATAKGQNPTTVAKSSHSTDFIQGTYSRNIPVQVKSGNESIIHFSDSSSRYPYTVYAWSDDTNFEYPVLVMVRQKRAGTSWQLPLAVESRTGTLKFQNTSRTLCHNNMDKISRIPRYDILDPTKTYDFDKTLTLSVSTASAQLMSVVLRVEEHDNFYLEENKDYEIQVSPSAPRYFYYKYLERNDSTYTSTVILEVFSEDDICLTVSIQNASCPVFDLNKDISFKGQYQTITTKGGIIIKRKKFPSGFFVVFVAKGDNYECTHENSLIPAPNNVRTVETLTRLTKIRFTLKPTIFKNAYVQASVSVLAGTLIYYVVVLGLSWAVFIYKRKQQKRKVPGNQTELEVENLNANSVPLEIVEVKETVRSYEELQNKGRVMLSDLATKSPEHLVRKSYEYFWHIISIAIFYGIPVVQLVITYQRILNDTGNQDVCYYNFLCAHPFWIFSDFNHIFSNVGYILAGLAFFVITTYKDKHVKNTLPNYGIPKQFGLYYAMGLSLIMEGVLSACYHICPNQSNFQFDTSFMYIMVTLSIIKLYQNRHPDVNATAYATFMIVGFAIFATMIGVVAGHLILWILFIMAYFSLCLYVSLKVYFMREALIGLKNVIRIRTEHGILKAVTPVKKERFTYILIGNAINIILAGLLSYFFYHNFPTYLLALLIANAVFYTSVYTIMKKKNGERICFQAKVFLVLAVVTWAIAIWCFRNKSISWTATPAKSRQRNRECLLLDYYDYHDIWHLLSASALFFTFMLFLCLDDDLIDTPHTHIVVF